MVHNDMSTYVHTEHNRVHEYIQSTTNISSYLVLKFHTSLRIYKNIIILLVFVIYLAVMIFTFYN